MDKEDRQKLNSIMGELNSVIKDLKKVSSGLRSSSFEGIGNDRCADKIDDLVNKYQKAYNRLNSI